MKPAHVVLTMLLGVGMLGCVPEWARQNETGLIMEIASILAATPGSEPQNVSGDPLFLLADVSNGLNENALVTVNIYRKNPTVASTSALEHVRLERYEVRFFRSDGRSQEGVDVPFRFTAPLAERFHTPTDVGEIEILAPIVVVRDQAKSEPPLLNLVRSPGTGGAGGGVIPGGFGGPLTVSVIAEITVHARQVTTGEGLTASANFSVTFADF